MQAAIHIIIGGGLGIVAAWAVTRLPKTLPPRKRRDSVGYWDRYTWRRRE